MGGNHAKAYKVLIPSLKKIDTSEKQAVPVEQVSDLIYQIFKNPKPKTNPPSKVRRISLIQSAW